jgi:hypothetical protein
MMDKKKMDMKMTKMKKKAPAKATKVPAGAKKTVKKGKTY